MDHASFSQFADEFHELRCRFSGSDKNSADLVSEFRECAARAGRLVLRNIRRRDIEPPRNRDHLPWLRFVHYKDTRTRFVRCRHSSGRVVLNIDPPSSFADLAARFCLHQHFGPGSRIPDSRRCRAAFEHRHLFIEAATRWLPTASSVTFELPSWQATTDDQADIAFVSDWTALDGMSNAPKRAIPVSSQPSFVLPLISASERACRSLALGEAFPPMHVAVDAAASAAMPTPSGVPPCESIDEDLWLSAAHIAARFELPPEPLRKRLARWRRKRLLDRENWREVPDAAPREPRHLYRVKAVFPIMQALHSAIASSETSVKRPAN